MANVKITELTAATALAGTDVLPIVDVGADATKKVSVSDLLRNLPDGTASAPALAFADDQNTGVLSPGNNSLAFATSGTQRLVIDSSGNVGINTTTPNHLLDVEKADAAIRVNALTGNSTAYLSCQDNTGIAGIYFGDAGSASAGRIQYRNNGDSLAFDTNGGERLRIDSSGRVGIGTSSPTVLLDLESTSPIIRLTDSDATGTPECQISGAGGDLILEADRDNEKSDSLIKFLVDGSERMRIDSSGRVGVGTSSPSAPLVVRGGSASNPTIRIEGGSSGNDNARIESKYNLVLACNGDGNQTNRKIQFRNDATDLVTIDSSGRMLVGLSTARQTGSGFTAFSQVEGGDSVSSGSLTITSNRSIDDLGARLNFARSKGGSVGSNTVVDDNAELGGIYFWGADGTDTNSQGAEIIAEVDGTPGSNDMPTRLVFGTTADGASSPTERMRIKNNGDVSCGAAAHLDGFSITSSSATGSRFASTGTAVHFASGTSALVLSRQTNDGTIVSLRQAGSGEGSISVSGSTVSYNGGHLSRWSQLTGGAERTEILRGSVLSNLDEMCEWGDEDNEQLNRMKVSDVEGDVNVSGVFQSWDDDDDTYTNDFFCAMTGDFIIRIAQGTTVARGDLLMSAGDGTAKPQDDDIVRSKTIAKVTSTTVSTTYADGSYCVPCVLMAC